MHTLLRVTKGCTCQAKFFTESRMLQRQVRVKLLSVPAPAALPFSSTATQAPTPASMFIGNVMHPNGNIAEHLVANGLARVVDWHAGMLSTVGGMERLRSAEAYVYTRSIWNTAVDSRSSQGSQGKETVHVRAFRFWCCHTFWNTIQWCCCIWRQTIVRGKCYSHMEWRPD